METNLSDSGGTFGATTFRKQLCSAGGVFVDNAFRSADKQQTDIIQKAGGRNKTCSDTVQVTEWQKMMEQSAIVQLLQKEIAWETTLNKLTYIYF